MQNDKMMIEVEQLQRSHQADLMPCMCHDHAKTVPNLGNDFLMEKIEKDAENPMEDMEVRHEQCFS